jgi:type III secretion system HrpB1/HrpK family protein
MLLQVDKKRPELADALIALIGLALAREADSLAQTMFDLARRLRPESPRLEAFQGWFYLRQGDVAAAGRHLRSAVEALGDKAGTARTLLAMVLCAQGDASWLLHAQAIITDGRDENSVALIKTLMNDANVPTPHVSEHAATETQLHPAGHEPNARSKQIMYLRA